MNQTIKKALSGLIIAVVAAAVLTTIALVATNVRAQEIYTFVTKWGSYGTEGGQFNYPRGVAVDSSGYVYVVDYNNHRIQKFTSNGIFVTKWGSGGTGDGYFYYPYSIAVDSLENVYVADTNNNRIQKFTSNGIFVTKWGSGGSEDGQFSYPLGIAADSSGNVYVTDYNNNRIQKFTSDGDFITKWGSYGSEDGQFSHPFGVAVDSSGYIYVVDISNNRIQKFTSNGTFITKWGSYGSEDGQFNWPFGIAVDSSGYVYVVDYNNHRIQKFAPPAPADITPPITILSLSGTSGENDWYTSDVKVILSAVDNEGGVGVEKTEYSFDGQNWQTYAEPLTISQEGINQLYYRSIDKAGNIEETKSTEIKIDQTPPQLQLYASPNILWPPNNKMVKVTIGGSAQDSLSGVAPTSFGVIDEYGQVQPTISDFGDVIQLEASRNGNDRDGRLYTISATATDQAGNQSTASTAVICPHDRRK